MFRAFTFDAVSPPAYSVYEAERAAMNVSPTSKAIDPRQLASRPLTPPCTMGDLAVQLNQQTLRIIEPRDSDDGCTSPTGQMQQPRPTYSRVAASLMRMQRQSSSRMQCCSSHVRDISKLVSMIEAEEQCTVNDSISRTCSTSSALSSPLPSPSTSATSGDDEGVDMDYDIPARDIGALAGMPQWRAGERRDSCIRVTKPVRMRKRSKENGVSKRRPS